ncbi:MAG TPA: FtsX-like permease family protein, partial [Thermomicrobiaceae bacterium]|nr:FtsX-like permease family protein [Thermomicrobiaceae bacterium]
MNSLFGVPMQSIMIALLVLFALCLAVGGWVFLRQRIIFRMGLRNVPRRRSQTILIVIGLMLSTLIISAALTTGDTLDGSIKSTVTDVSQNTHELVVKSTTGNPYNDNGAGPQPGVTFPDTVYTNLKQKLAGNSQIATITPMLSESVPAVDPRTRLSEPDLIMMGIDQATIGPVGQIKSTGGSTIDLNSLPADSIVLGKTPADKMDAKVGDTLTVYVNNAPHQLKVADIATDWIGTGTLTAGTDGGFAMPLTRAQELIGRPGAISFIAIANTGGVGPSDAVKDTINNALQGTPYTAVTVLKDGLHFAELAGNIFTTLFVVLGLFSIAAGILLIFLIFVLLAAERQSEMGMARAVGLRRRQLTQMFLAEGITYDLLSALVGAALGVGVALVIAQVMGGLVGSFFHIKPTFTWRSLVVAYTLGVVVTFLTILVSSWRVSRLNIVQAIRDIPDPVHQKASRRWLIFGILAIVIGAIMLMSGANSHSAFLFMTGVTLVPLGLAMILRRVGVSARLVYSIASIIVLAFWLMPNSLSEKLLPKLDGGMEMFFLSGIMMVAAATILIIWNAEVITWIIGLFGRAFSRWLPAVKTAIAYPMASKGRTGMTIAMFSLIIFSLVMMATMNANITAVFTGDAAAAGWSIQATQPPTNPIGNFQQTLAKNNVNTKPIEAVGKLDMIGASGVAIRPAGTQEWKTYAANGADANFINDSDLSLSIRATGYASDKAALDAVRDNPNLAIIDSNAIPASGGFGGGDGFTLTGVKSSQKTMAP